jgi:hypothetical protein
MQLMQLDRCLIALACGLALTTAVQAQTSKDFAVMGRVAWAAFGCSSLAAQMKEQKEQERLFLLGYEQGKVFIEAAQAKKVERKDISEEVPIGMTLLLQGPTPDFMLGRVYESAQEEALKSVLRTNGNLNTDEVQASLARSTYTKQNCRLVRAVR